MCLSTLAWSEVWSSHIRFVPARAHEFIVYAMFVEDAGQISTDRHMNTRRNTCETDSGKCDHVTSVFRSSIAIECGC